MLHAENKMKKLNKINSQKINRIKRRKRRIVKELLFINKKPNWIKHNNFTIIKIFKKIIGLSHEDNNIPIKIVLK